MINNTQFIVSFILPIVSIIIAIISIGIAIYRELSGPNISLINKPEFQMKKYEGSKDIIPESFSLNEVSLIFANYGRTGGTIIECVFNFLPTKEFKVFYDKLSFDFFLKDKMPEISMNPVVISQGDNCVLKFQLIISTIDWKMGALEEILENVQKIKHAISLTFEEGKKRFNDFCTFLTESDELGEVSCTAKITVGRVWKKVENRILFKGIPVKNPYKGKHNIFKDRIHNWDHIYPRLDGLLNQFFSLPQSLLKELEDNLKILKNQVNESNLPQAILNTSNYDNLRSSISHFSPSYIIKQNNELSDQITDVYKNIRNYNSDINSLLRLGEKRANDDFIEINKKMEPLHNKINNIIENLSETIKKYR